jgi:spore germination cell wall hydrolase CwlJ-like protein
MCTPFRIFIYKIFHTIEGRVHMNKKFGRISHITLITIFALTAASMVFYNSNMQSSSKVKDAPTNNAFLQERNQLSDSKSVPKEAIIPKVQSATPVPTPDVAKPSPTPKASSIPTAPSVKSSSNTAVNKTTKAASSSTSTSTKVNKVTTSPKPAPKPVVYTISGNGRSYSVTAEERKLFARLVSAEAGGESYEGKLAVATVVINRVISGTFPGSVTMVIMGKESGYYQFTPVADGRINEPPSTDALKAVDQVLGGYRSFSAKVMWFQNPRKSTSTWITMNKTYFKTIGNHDFYF